MLVIFLSYILISIMFSMHDKLSSHGLNELCFEKFDCYYHFFNNFNEVLKELIFLFQISFWIIGIMATRLALISYMSTISSSQSNIHLSNLKSFKEYTEYLFNSYNFFKFENLDIMKLYNLAFPASSQGIISFKKNSEYTTWLREINKQIEKSNNMLNGTEPKSFCYKKHQESMIKILAKGGFKITYQPRSHYLEVEIQLFELLDKINNEYLRLIDFSFAKRIYV